MSTPNPGTTPWVPMWNLNGGMDLRYNGAWQAGNYYDGDVVVYQGVTYLCVRPTNKAPTPWAPGQLVVQPSVRVYRSTAQSIAHATTTPVIFDSVRWDQGPSAHWNINNPTRLTCQVAGTYLVWGNVSWAGVAAGVYRQSLIRVNGVQIAAPGGTWSFTPSGTQATIAPISTILNLNVGDYVELTAYQDSGAALSTNASDGVNNRWQNEFGMALLGGMQGSPGLAANLNYGTTLPPSPADGQEAVLVDSITNPTYQWRFRYNAGSTSSYKWEFVGGTPLSNEIATQEGFSYTGGYMDSPTVGPQVTVPRAGEYQIEYGGGIVLSATNYWYYNLNIGGVQSDQWGPYGTNGNNTVVWRKVSRRIIAAGVLVKIQYSAGLTGNMTIYNRGLHITPVRVA